MVSGSNDTVFRKRTLITRIAGVFFLCAGVALILLGLLETRCFSLFSEGGRFHYEGFGFGSFMFGNIAAQVIAYCLTGAVLTFLGYGHLSLRRWAAKLACCLMRAWLLIGLPVIAVVFFLLLASKELTTGAAVIALAALALSYFVLPWLVIRYFGGPKAGLFYEAADPGHRWADRIPARIAVLSILYAFFIAGLQVLLFFGGIFPLFGSFVRGTGGTVLIAVTTLLFVLLIRGTLSRRLWAWRGACVLLGLLAVLAVSASLCTGYSDLLSALSFPPAEMRFLAGVPVQGWHLAVLSGIPLLAGLLAAATSRRCFKDPRRPARNQ